MKKLLLIPLFIAGGAFAGYGNEPTGCPSGDNIPVDSDKCEHTIKKVEPVEKQPLESFRGVGSSGSWETTLPSVGAEHESIVKY